MRAFAGRRSGLDPFVHLLGVEPDAKVAALAGLTVENVRAYRTRRGIVAAAPRRRLQAGVAPLPSEQWAFTVEVEASTGRLTYAVVAGHIGEAAQIAVATVGARGTVRGVTRLAPMLMPATAA